MVVGKKKREIYAHERRRRRTEGESSTFTTIPATLRGSAVLVFISQGKESLLTRFYTTSLASLLLSVLAGKSFILLQQ